MNLISNILKQQKLFIIDGALGTYIEDKGYDVKDKLWSAKFLQDSPEVIEQVHTDYLEAGADCIITASYQASYEGFIEKGCSEQEAKKLIQSSIILAQKVRNKFWKNTDKTNRVKPLVAASIGPYGAYLADGSEYTGDYNISDDELFNFHKKRLQAIIETKPDILACETLPSLHEAKIILKALREFPHICTWFSFSAKDALHVRNGESIKECTKWIENQEDIESIGINCTATEHITPILQNIRDICTKPIVLYPNYSAYVASSKTWEKSEIPDDFGKLAFHWKQLGASGVGGCCQTTPKEISQISKWVRA